MVSAKVNKYKPLVWVHMLGLEGNMYNRSDRELL